jgi:hypothetical protein
MINVTLLVRLVDIRVLVRPSISIRQSSIFPFSRMHSSVAPCWNHCRKMLSSSRVCRSLLYQNPLSETDDSCDSGAIPSALPALAAAAGGNNGISGVSSSTNAASSTGGAAVSKESQAARKSASAGSSRQTTLNAFVITKRGRDVDDDDDDDDFGDDEEDEEAKVVDRRWLEACTVVLLVEDIVAQPADAALGSDRPNAMPSASSPSSSSSSSSSASLSSSPPSPRRYEVHVRCPSHAQCTALLAARRGHALLLHGLQTTRSLAPPVFEQQTSTVDSHRVTNGARDHNTLGSSDGACGHLNGDQDNHSNGGSSSGNADIHHDDSSDSAGGRLICELTRGTAAHWRPFSVEGDARLVYNLSLLPGVLASPVLFRARSVVWYWGEKRRERER